MAPERREIALRWVVAPGDTHEPDLSKIAVHFYRAAFGVNSPQCEIAVDGEVWMVAMPVIPVGAHEPMAKCLGGTWHGADCPVLMACKDYDQSDPRQGSLDV